jgi:mannose-6-phosphate isomerase
MSDAEKVYPLVSEPVLKSKIWGGRKIESLLGIPLPEGDRVGEAWLVADLREGASSIQNGACAGQSLSEVTRLWGEAMIGAAWAGKPTGERFPLLVKFLDAQDNLSVQVHPDDAACRIDFPDDFSKDESWIILAVDPGGSILHGFRPGTTLDDFDRLLAEDRVVECMRSVEVQPGQVFRVAPGTVHALCRGVVILEIQEPSDSTFRIYDYNRPGDDGKPRALHVEASRKVMRFGDDSPPAIEPEIVAKPWGAHELLVDVSAYRIERATIQAPVAWDVDPRSAQVLIVIDGGIRLESGGDGMALTAGATVVLPAALGSVEMQPSGDSALCILAGAGGVAMIG